MLIADKATALLSYSWFLEYNSVCVKLACNRFIDYWNIHVMLCKYTLNMQKNKKTVSITLNLDVNF